MNMTEIRAHAYVLADRAALQAETIAARELREGRHHSAAEWLSTAYEFRETMKYCTFRNSTQNVEE